MGGPVSSNFQLNSFSKNKDGGTIADINARAGVFAGGDIPIIDAKGNISPSGVMKGLDNFNNLYNRPKK